MYIINKILIFDIWGDFAHYRKIYTTTSPLTFSIPPRTALSGLISAILGLENKNNDYLKYFNLNKSKIGVEIKNPIKKINFAENFIHTKNAKGIGMNLITDRTRINLEFLKNPKYRIYFWHNDDDIYYSLKRYLLEHKSIFTTCLGLSEHIANFTFIGEFDIHKKNSNNEIIINSVIPIKSMNKINFIYNKDIELFKEKLPIEMNQNRVVTAYSNILYEKNGKPISLELIKPHYSVNYDGKIKNILFME